MGGQIDNIVLEIPWDGHFGYGFAKLTESYEKMDSISGHAGGILWEHYQRMCTAQVTN